MGEQFTDQEKLEEVIEKEVGIYFPIDDNTKWLRI